MKVNEQETRAMESEGYICSACKRHIGKNYCGYCGEFYNVGHKEDCRMLNERDNHEGHRR